MAFPKLNRNLLAVVLLAGLAAVCVSLGRWQMDRAAERVAIAQAIEAESKSHPLALKADTLAGELREWRPASATGVWLDAYTVLLDNRNLDGRPGWWLATPLQLADAPDNTAVLVLRGWLPRPLGHALPELPPTPDTTQHVGGQLRARVPQLYELWQFSGRDTSALPNVWRPGEPPLVQNLDLARYEHATGLKLLSAVLEQTDAEPPGDTLRRDWPTPSLDADKNRGYALQWFSFAAIAGGAALLILWRALRRSAGKRRQPRT